jgi:hypothetical protein
VREDKLRKRRSKSGLLIIMSQTSSFDSKRVFSVRNVNNSLQHSIDVLMDFSNAIKKRGSEVENVMGVTYSHGFYRRDRNHAKQYNYF